MKKFVQWLIEKGIISEENAEEAREMANTMSEPEKSGHTPPASAPPGQNVPAGYVHMSQVSEIVEKAVADATAPFSKKLDEEKKARETLAEERSKQKEAELKANVATLLTNSEKEGRITSKEAREKWEKRLLADFDSWKEALEEIPANPAVNRDAKKVTTSGTDTKGESGKEAIGKSNRLEMYESAVAAFGGGE